MSGDSLCLLVVGILEGRHFPKLKNDDEIYVEAKFGSKLLSTDPVLAQGKPSFNCELGFELLRKDLQLHRLQRTPVKLQLFTQGSSSMGLMSPLGQIVLDLKQAKESPADPVWFPVLHCKHRGSRPEILISFYLETPKRNVSELSTKQLEMSTVQRRDQEQKNPVLQSTQIDSHSESPGLRHQGELPASPELQPTNGELQYTLNSSRDYYIFNRDGDVGRIFRLTVTLVFAERLEKLNLTSLNSPFCFMYHLLGNQVRSEPFQLLSQPDFPAERATVRIKALRATLNQFICKLDHLDVFLTSQADSQPANIIGKARVPLSSLISHGVAEGIYPIGEEFLNVPLQDSPCVGLSATMQLEESQNKSTASDDESHKTLTSEQDGGNNHNNSSSNSQSKSTAPSNRASESNLTNRDSPTASMNEITVSDKSVTNSATSENTSAANQRKPAVNEKNDEEKEVTRRSKKHREKTGDDLEKNTVHSKHENDAKTVHDDDKKKNESRKSDKSRTVNDIPTHDNGTSSTVPTLINVLTHFCLSIDLRCVRFLAHQPFPVCFVQYNYPFVGSNVPTRTSTFPTDLQKKIIPEGQNTFCFVTSFARLREAFTKLPLTLELVSDNSNVGLAHVDLEPLLKSPASFFSHSEHVRGHRSTFTCQATFMSREAPAIAEVSVYLSLDRLEGKAHSGCVSRMQPAVSHLASSAQAHLPASKHLRQPTQDELHVALELEMWREQQEELFRVHLKKQEEAHLSALAQEWKERDAEREALLKVRIDECLRLEEKLRKALSDVDGREIKLQRKEEWIKQQEATLRRNAEEFNRKMKEQETEKMTRLERQNNETEIVQQAQILSLEKDLKQTKEDLQKALSSKSKYKRMWATTFKDLVTARRLSAQPPPPTQMSPFLSPSTSGVETEAKTRINEQRVLLEKEKLDLKNIQDEVRRLKDNSLLIDDSSLASTSQGDVSRVDSEYLQRLIEERQMLLRTGSYLPDSRVIQQLDRHINIARNSL